MMKRNFRRGWKRGICVIVLLGLLFAVMPAAAMPEAGASGRPGGGVERFGKKELTGYLGFSSDKEVVVYFKGHEPLLSLLIDANAKWGTILVGCNPEHEVQTMVMLALVSVPGSEGYEIGYWDWENRRVYNTDSFIPVFESMRWSLWNEGAWGWARSAVSLGDLQATRCNPGFLPPAWQIMQAANADQGTPSAPNGTITGRFYVELASALTVLVVPEIKKLEDSANMLYLFGRNRNVRTLYPIVDLGGSEADFYTYGSDPLPAFKRSQP